MLNNSEFIRSVQIILRRFFIHFEGSDYPAEERHAYSLAYALEKCNTGIRLLKGSLTSNGVNVSFEQIQMSLQTDATNLKNCK